MMICQHIGCVRRVCSSSRARRHLRAGNNTPQTFDSPHQDDADPEDFDNAYTVVYARYGHKRTFSE